MGRVSVFSSIKSNSCSRRLCLNAALCFIQFLCIFLLSSASYAFEDNIENDLQSSLEQSRGIVEKVQAKLAASASVSEEITLLKKTADDIRITHLLLLS